MWLFINVIFFQSISVNEKIPVTIFKSLIFHSANAIQITKNELINHYTICDEITGSFANFIGCSARTPSEYGHNCVIIYNAYIPSSLLMIGSAPDTLQWRHNERNVVSNHQPHDCLSKRLLRRRSKKTSKLRVTGLCEGNSPVTGWFPAQRASNAENASIWWHNHTYYDIQVRYQMANGVLCVITRL